MIQVVTRLFALLLLAVNSFADVRRQKICPVLTIAGGITGLAVAAVWRAVTPASYASSLAPGGIFLLFSLLTRGAVGAGDGLLLISLAGFFDCQDICTIVFFGMLLSSVYAGRELLCGRRGDHSYAFVPFLLGGYVLYLLAEWRIR